MIAICGSTGTGKSQLAVEIAKHLGTCEIISADSMQIYKGLDVITNKVTKEEMQGIPHHLMSFLTPEQDETYDVGSFIRDAHIVMNDLHHRDCIPVVAGGTTYYIQHLLLPGRLVSNTATNIERPSTLDLSSEQITEIANRASRIKMKGEQINLLQQVINLPYGSTELQADPVEVWKLLNLLDQEMANRWHYKDTRKILRSIRVLFETGRRHSEIIKEQSLERQASESDTEAPNEGKVEAKRILIFNVQCDRDVLNQRLDRRVDKMIDVSNVACVQPKSMM